MAIAPSTNDLARTINLSGAIIPRTNLSRANLSGADLSDANLTGANLSMALLVGANLTGCVLAEANLAHAELSGANLTKADLSRADLSGTRFDGANLDHANLKETDLRNAKLSGALNLTWYQVLDGWLDDTTMLPDYLSEADLLDHLARSHPPTSWHAEYAGRLNVLLRELSNLAEKSRKRSFNSILRDIDSARYEQLRSTRIEQRNDDSD